MDRARAREIQVIEDSQRRLFEYLACHPCVDCAQTDIRVLEFDHVHGKKSGNISRMAGLGYSWSTIEAEIAKCEVECGNCHRIKENEKSDSWRRYSGALAGHARSHNARSNAENKQRLYVYLSSHPCVDCGQTDVRVLEFDHVRGTKSAYRNKLLNGAVSWKTIEAEIAKCEVRCTNCHRIKTLERGKWWRFGLFE